MPRRLAVGGAVVAASLSWTTAGAGGGAADLRWQRFAAVRGAVDVAGPRADGRFVVAAREGLFLLDRRGALEPFARGPGGYAPARGEAYIALTQRRRVRGAGCSFQRDDVYALEPIDHPGVVWIRRTGQARRLLDLPPSSFLSSIAFDGTGRFGHRLLVTALVAGRTTLYAIDCRGKARLVFRNGPKVEGGSAVAPPRFGRFGGQLIAADEFSGTIYGFGPRGGAHVVARSRLPAGQDVGVESAGFVPPRFTRRGVAYVADLGAPGSPTEGTDAILRVTGTQLTRAGVRAGDLIVATEAAGRTLRVRCRRLCTAKAVGQALAATHAEGHIVVAAE
jgi:hypothetical protein